MPTVAPYPATLDDLAKVEGKAELVAGRIVHLMPSGFWPGQVAYRITRSLEDYSPTLGYGTHVPDNIGYSFDPPLLSGRQSLSPDSSFFAGSPPPRHMPFIDGFPVFAAEVRSQHDYGPTPDREYAAKRKDYFFAGTLVVWDVDPLAETVTRYRASDPDTPVVFGRGQVADAEPAVPGWRLSVDDLFR